MKQLRIGFLLPRYNQPSKTYLYASARRASRARPGLGSAAPVRAASEAEIR